MVAASIFFITSCDEDATCDITQSDFTGQYSVSEDCSSSAPAAYTVTISAGSTDTEVLMANVWDSYAAAVKATIDCETLTIERQDPDGDKYFIEGNGILEKRDNDVIVITISYTVKNENDPANIETDACSQTIYTKL